MILRSQLLFNSRTLNYLVIRSFSISSWFPQSSPIWDSREIPHFVIFSLYTPSWFDCSPPIYDHRVSIAFWVCILCVTVWFPQSQLPCDSLTPNFFDYSWKHFLRFKSLIRFFVKFKVFIFYKFSALRYWRLWIDF